MLNDVEDSYDKRKVKRRHLIYYLRVFSRNTGEMIGHMVDVTPEGIMLISEKPIELNTKYQLRMDLPVEIWGTQHLDFEAKSLWGRRDVNPDFYNTGFEIQGEDWKRIETIERLISQYGFSD